MGVADGTAGRRSAFRADNELALHVPDPDAAAAFYANVLGCRVVRREPDWIEVVSGALRLSLLRISVERSPSMSLRNLLSEARRLTGRT